MVFKKRAAERSDVWFRWAYVAWVGYSLSMGARLLVFATHLLSNHVTDYLSMVSFVCLIAMLVMFFLSNYHKRREAKIRLLPVAETPAVDSWPPAPKAE